MTNPYESPSTEISPLATVDNRGFYVGGFRLVALLALVFGSCIGAMINFLAAESLFFIWFFSASGWFVALAIVIGNIRKPRFSFEAVLRLALGLAFPAYILYVPVCSVSSILTQGWLPSQNEYGPSPSGVVFGSAFAFLVILLSIAAILRVYCKVPDRPEAPVPDKAIDQQRENEFL